MPIPLIDDRIKYRGVTVLRTLNGKALRELKDILVLQIEDGTLKKAPEPVAVLIPYSIYMEMQRVLWPSSILPALDAHFKNANAPATDYEHPLAQEEDARTADLSASSGLKDIVDRVIDELHEANSPIPNPSISEWGVDGFGSKKHGDLPTLPNLARTQSGHLYRRGEQHECGVADCPANKVVLTAIGTDATPRGTKFSRVDPNAEPVFDDGPAMDEPLELGIALAQAGPVCSHCQKPNEKTLCSDCFLAGHRENCLVCTDFTKGAKGGDV